MFLGGSAPHLSVREAQLELIPPRKKRMNMKKIKGYLSDKFYKHLDAPLKLKKKVIDSNSGKKKFEEIPNRINEIHSYVSNPKNICKRAFFPFIGFSIEERRGAKILDLEKNGNGSIIKKRPIRYASHKDNAIFSYYASLLYPLYEDKLKRLNIQDVVIAYRRSEYLKTKNADNIHLAYDVFKEIQKRRNCIALAFDIKSFYDNIDHQKLKEEWIKLLNNDVLKKRLPDDHYKIYKTLTNYSYIHRKAIEIYFNCNAPKLLGKCCEKCKTPMKFKFGHKIFKNMKDFHKFKKWYSEHPEFKLWDLSDDELMYKEQILASTKTFNFNVGILDPKPYGIPQGSALSALLANIYMIPFDLEMKKYAQEKGAIYRRYSDDIMFICDKKYEKKAMKEIPEKIRKRGDHLIIHKITKGDKKSKSKYYDFTSPDIKKRPLQYLGLEFNGETIKLRNSSLARYLRKSKRGITAIKISVQNKIISFLYNNKDIDTIKPHIHRKTIYERYTYLGKRNFLSYAYRAAKNTNSRHIKKQLKRHFVRVLHLIDVADYGLKKFYQLMKNKQKKK